MRDESKRLLEKYNSTITVQIDGDLNKDKPKSRFADEVNQLQLKFIESQKKIQSKLDYFYAPYDRKNNKAYKPSKG